MPKSITLQYSRDEKCIKIIGGIQTLLFPNGQRGIPFKNKKDIITPEDSILLDTMYEPAVDKDGYIHNVFYDQHSSTLRKPTFQGNDWYRLVLLKGVRVFSFTGKVIKNARAETGRDVLVLGSFNETFQLIYPDGTTVNSKLIW